MARNYFVDTLLYTVADQTTISTSTTETLLAPNYTFPANYFEVGRTARFTMMGKCSNMNPTPGTLTIKAHIGTTSLAAGVSATGALALDTAAAHTDFTWMVQGLIVCRSVGTSGTVVIAGKADFSNLTASAALLGGGMPNFLPATAPGATITIDTTSAELFGLAATFNTSNAANAITCQYYHLEGLN